MEGIPTSIGKGQTITLSHLAPFVEESRKRIREEVKEEFKLANSALSDDDLELIVEKRVKQEINAGVQTIQYQICTLLTCNGQTPFVSVFMYLNEVSDSKTRDDLALIIEEVLNQRIQGIKNEKGVWITPAFPYSLGAVLTENLVNL